MKATAPPPLLAVPWQHRASAWFVTEPPDPISSWVPFGKQHWPVDLRFPEQHSAFAIDVLAVPPFVPLACDIGMQQSPDTKGEAPKLPVFAAIAVVLLFVFVRTVPVQHVAAPDAGAPLLGEQHWPVVPP